MNSRIRKRLSRHHRVRKKISGNASVPRLVVFRSNKHIYAQLIDDSQNRTIVAYTDYQLQDKKKKDSNSMLTRIEEAHQVGLNLAKMASTKKIKRVVFDRGGYRYHGRVKTLAEGAREGGLLF